MPVWVGACDSNFAMQRSNIISALSASGLDLSISFIIKIGHGQSRDYCGTASTRGCINSRNSIDIDRFHTNRNQSFQFEEKIVRTPGGLYVVTRNSTPVFIIIFFLFMDFFNNFWSVWKFFKIENLKLSLYWNAGMSFSKVFQEFPLI